MVSANLCQLNESNSRNEFQIFLIFVVFYCQIVADVFGIEEVLIFKGEHKDAVYAASGDMLDGYFYDLLMNLLAEKKVDHEFASSLSELATQYEQTQFINLLKETKKFFQSK